MADPILAPQQWIAAANMVQRRGANPKIVMVAVQGWVLALPDGTRLAYQDGTAARVFRSAGQAADAFKSYGLEGHPDLPASGVIL